MKKKIFNLAVELMIMKHALYFFPAVIFITALFSSCKKTKDYPIEPIIEFKELVKFTDATGIDTVAKLTLSFTDGDGDLGYRNGDTVPPFNPGNEFFYNFFMKIFYMDNGTFTEIIFPSDFPPNYRIPAIESNDHSKATAGDLLVNINVKDLGLELITPRDTFKFEVYVSDRALHKSNTITASEIFLNLKN